MSTIESVKSHLSQHPLSDNDKAILADLSEWLNSARFEKQIDTDEFEVCVDDELSKRWKLLEQMDLVKVSSR